MIIIPITYYYSSRYGVFGRLESGTDTKSHDESSVAAVRSFHEAARASITGDPVLDQSFNRPPTHLDKHCFLFRSWKTFNIIHFTSLISSQERTEVDCENRTFLSREYAEISHTVDKRSLNYLSDACWETPVGRAEKDIRVCVFSATISFLIFHKDNECFVCSFSSV